MALSTDSTATVTAQVPKGMKVALETLALSTGQGPGDLVTEAIGHYLAAQRAQIAQIEAGLRAADAGDFATDAETANASLSRRSAATSRSAARS